MRAGTHILLVDDYPDALDIWAFYLRSRGYRVATASNGMEAIEQVERLSPDLIVLDLEMPYLSGIDVARHLRAGPTTRDIPLLAATGYSHTGQLDRAREAGFDTILIKPVEPDVLVEAIERLLQPVRAPLIQPGRFSMENGHDNG